MDINILTKSIIGIFLLCSGIKDIKTKQISLHFIIVVSIIIALTYVFQHAAIVSGILGSLVGFFLLFISKISRGQVGMGDGLVLITTGLGLGLWNNILLLLYGLLLCSLFAIVLIVFRHADRKKTIPFIPFLFISYLGIILS